jgi:hypothetical protein
MCWMYGCVGCMDVFDVWMCLMYGCVGCMDVLDVWMCLMYGCVGCMDAPLKIHSLLASASRTQLVTSRVTLQFQTAQLKSIPPLIFLLFPIG